MAEKTDILLIGPARPVIAKGLMPAFNVHQLPRDGRDEFFSSLRRLRWRMFAGERH